MRPSPLLAAFLAPAAALFAPDDWQVCVVADAADPATRRITSDQAVELQEDKANAVLLLIDSHDVGAGMDGMAPY